MAALNPSLDRSKARVNEADASKLTIEFNCPWPKPFYRAEYPDPVDWSCRSSVAALNNWRSSRLYYWFGAPQARRRNFYTEDEEAWILHEGKNKGYRSWDQIAQKFNQTFRAQALDDDDEERPKLSGSAIHGKALWMLRKREVDTAVNPHDAMDYPSDAGEGEIMEERMMKQKTCLRPWEL